MDMAVDYYAMFAACDGCDDLPVAASLAAAYCADAFVTAASDVFSSGARQNLGHLGEPSIENGRVSPPPLCPEL